MSNISISVLIPTYQRIGLFEECLQSILKQTYPKDYVEIIIVDDAQFDKVFNFTKTLTNHNIRYLKGEGKGPASARNIAAKNAENEILAFIDDDCVADKYWLENIAISFQKYPDLSACGGKITNIITKGIFKGIDYRMRNLDDIQQKKPYFLEFKFMPLQLIGTENLAVKKDIFMNVGGFNEKFAWAGENPDFIYNLLKNKYKVYFNPGISVYHYARYRLKDIALGMYRYGVFDTVNFKTHFSNWLVLDMYILKALGMNTYFYLPSFPVTCCIRLDLLKLIIFLIAVAIFNPFAGLCLFLLFLLSTFLKFKKILLGLTFFCYSIYRDFWYLLGHLVGSVKNSVFYI